MSRSIITSEEKIDDILSRGVHEIYTKEDLKKKLMSGKQLHLKLGTDVTGANLHLGHAVVHRKIRDFQELGHKITLIIGDFTTLVGDHSDKVDMRAETTELEISKNEQTYKDQFFKTVLKDQTEIKHNAEWLSKLNFNDVINLARQFTIAQMLERETFMLRYKENKPIGLDEFLYPLMQGYDSVAIKCDVEFGGTDQTFNLLAGRKLTEYFKQDPQCAVVMKLLTGSDGRPMGKSLKNFIPIMDTASDMYGKVMSIVDDIIWEYFELCTRIPMSEITEMKLAVKNGENPMKYKKLLALDIVTFYHGKEHAQKAQNHFEKTVQNKEVADEDIINIPISTNGEQKLIELLKSPEVSKHLESSVSEIRRLVEQGGVSVNNEVIKDINYLVNLNNSVSIKYGKRKFLKIN